MSTPAVVYDPTPALERSRVTVFFRGILWFPHYVTLLFYGIGYVFAVMFAWFAIVVTGKYPQGLYDFNVKVLKYYARLSSYLYLQVDQYPPFGLGDHPEYPTQLHIGPAKQEYSRVKALFRVVLGVPVVLINYAMFLVLGVMAVMVWFAGVILGKTPEGLHGPLNLGLSYYARAAAYFALVTEDWPAMTQDESTVAAAKGGDFAPSSFDAPAPPPPVATTPSPAPVPTSPTTTTPNPFGE